MLIQPRSKPAVAVLALTALPLPLHAIAARRHDPRVRSPSVHPVGADPHRTPLAAATTNSANPPAATANNANPSAATANSANPSAATPYGAKPSTPAGPAHARSSRLSRRRSASQGWRRRPRKPAGGGQDLVLRVGHAGSRHAAPRLAHAAGDPGDTILDYKFSPASITIHVGDTITWTNQGQAPHTATANNGSFDTGTLKNGASASHTFTQAGTFAYICSIHPFMHGTVVVLAAATTPPAPATGSSGSNGSGSSGSGSSGSGSSGSTSTTPAASTPTGPTLPVTGLDLVAALCSGVVLIGAGLALRRRSARTPSKPVRRMR